MTMNSRPNAYIENGMETLQALAWTTACTDFIRAVGGYPVYSTFGVLIAPGQLPDSIVPEGLTADQVEAAITRRTEEYLRKPRTLPWEDIVWRQQ